MKLLFVLLTIVAVSASPSWGDDDARPFSPEDLVSLPRLGSYVPSPDGSQVAFVVREPDLEGNRFTSHIWVVGLGEDSVARQLTWGGGNDWDPLWLSDRQLMFLSDRSGEQEVYVLDLGGGEARPVWKPRIPVRLIAYSAPASRLIFSARVFPTCAGDPIECTATKMERRKQRAETGIVFDSLFVRHWDRWEDGTRNHLFSVKLSDDGTPEHEPVDLMLGMDTDCPTEPWGGREDVAVSPDGKWVVFVAKNAKGSERAWSTNYDLWAVPLSGGVAPSCITASNRAWDGHPAFSPDGTRLAYLAMKRPGYESDRFRVMVMRWPGGEPKEVAPGWDRSPSELVWCASGSHLLVSADNFGNHTIYRIDLADGRVHPLVLKHHNAGIAPLSGGGFVFESDSFVRPPDLWVMEKGRRSPRRLTKIGDEKLRGVGFAPYRQISFRGAHGDTIYGYLFEPFGRVAGRTYPLALLVHGGPQGSFSDHFHFRWNPEVFACHGYAVLTVDFHGSTGYGQAFVDSIRDDWGGAPYQDLMAGVDWAVANVPWIDSERLVALGASFGGYMINWIQGHTTRFKALVCHDGNLDEYMAYFDTEELWFPEWEHKGTPWENPEGYLKHSPVRYVSRFKTPELVIHGAKDFRVVETQGLATFNALQRLGIPSRLLYFPDENHWVLKPANSLQWHRVVFDWIDRWANSDSNSKRK